jgi:hypothetical protein
VCKINFESSKEQGTVLLTPRKMRECSVGSLQFVSALSQAVETIPIPLNSSCSYFVHKRNAQEQTYKGKEKRNIIIPYKDEA